MRHDHQKFWRGLVGVGVLTIGLAGLSRSVPAGQIPISLDRTQEQDDVIPSLVQFSSFLLGEVDGNLVDQSTYSMVATNVPVQELLTSLAQKAKLSLDLVPGVQGDVTLNVTNQTLKGVLDRVVQQTNIRYRFKDDHLLVEPRDQKMVHDQSFVADKVTPLPNPW